MLDGAIIGSAVAEKSLVVDSNLDVADIRNLTTSGNVNTSNLNTETAMFTNKVSLSTTSSNFNSTESGIIIQSDAGNIYTENVKASGETINNVNLYSFKSGTIAADQTNITTEHASTFHISGSPNQGNNMTINSSSALFVDNGLTKLNGGLSVSGNINFNNSVFLKIKLILKVIYQYSVYQQMVKLKQVHL